MTGGFGMFAGGAGFAEVLDKGSHVRPDVFLSD